MATTSTTQYSDISLTEALADEILQESRPRRVVANLINYYSIAGQPTGTFKMNRWNDPGQAATATEGTAFTSTTQFGTTAVSVSLITDDAVEERIPGMSSVGELMNRGSFEQKFAALAPEAGLLSRMVFEKIENDLTGLFASLNGGTAVGSSGTNMSVANFQTALLTLETAEDLPHDDIVCSLDKQQLGDLRTDLTSLSAASSSVWSLSVADIVAHRPDLAMNGLKGQLLGVPIYTHGVGVRQTANSGADVVGAMFLRGSGAPEQGGGGQPGAFCLVEGRPIKITIEGDHRERAGEIQVNAKYAVAERADTWGVPIVTDA